MPTFELRGPNGTFEVDAPTMQAAAAAFRKLNAAGMSAGERGMDVLKGAGTGLAEGGIGIAGLPGDVIDLGQKAAGTQQAADKLVQEGQAARLEGKPTLPTSPQIKSTVERWTGPFYEPQTTEGQAARTMGQFAPGMMFPAGQGVGLAGRAVRNVVLPALGSEAAGQATQGRPSEPYARVFGAVGGTLTPSMIGRALTPFPAAPIRQQNVQTLMQEGVVPTAGQQTGSKALQYAESALGDLPGAGGRATQAVEQTGEQFTRAALRRIGENADRATPEVIDRAFTRIGGEFDRLAGSHTLRVDQQLGNDLQTAVSDYYGLVNEPNRAPAVTAYAREVLNATQNNGGVLPGEVYQSLRSRMERFAREAGGNQEAANAVREMRAALDDAMERSIAMSGNQADLGAWQEARRQYRDLLALSSVRTGATEGVVTPAQLANAASRQGQRAYARGHGDFADLAYAGESVLRPLPQSGTGPRVAAMSVPALLGAGGGYMLGGNEGAGYGGAGGALFSAMAPATVGRILMSPVAQRYLANQAFPLAGDNARTRTMAQMLLSEPRLQLEGPRQ